MDSARRISQILLDMLFLIRCISAAAAGACSWPAFYEPLFVRYSAYFGNTVASSPLSIELTIFLNTFPSRVTKNVAQPLLLPIHAL